MIHRIVVTGAESTGKTTLAQALAKYYDEPWTKEFVRGYVQQIDRELRPEDIESIARGQLATEDNQLEQAERLIIHDTNILSSIIYAKHYFRIELDWVSKQFKERNYTLYLLNMPDIPWKADPGQRESPTARTLLHQTFKAKLNFLKLPYIEVYGSKTERLQQAIENIERQVLNIER